MQGWGNGGLIHISQMYLASTDVNSQHVTIAEHDAPFQILARVSNTLFLPNTVAESCRTYTCTAEYRR